VIKGWYLATNYITPKSCSIFCTQTSRRTQTHRQILVKTTPATPVWLVQKQEVPLSAVHDANWLGYIYHAIIWRCNISNWTTYFNCSEPVKL